MTARLLFGAAMKYKKILIPLFVTLLLSGCLSKSIWREKLNAQIDVLGVQLYSDVNYKEINGVTASEEPCLRGYELSFDALDVTIGYGFNHKIRKITTRNRSTGMFEIKPGMIFGDGKKRILEAGFQEYVPPFTFRANGYLLTFLVDGNNTIFGLTLESLD
jgi:hypothetical protein